MYWIKIIQIILAVLLIMAILLQNRGAGVSGIFGGGGDYYRTKRGFDRTLFIATITISILFFSLSFLSIVL